MRILQRAPKGKELGGYSVCFIKAIRVGVVIITWEFESLEKVLAMKGAVNAIYVGEREYTDDLFYARTICPLCRFLLKDFTRRIHQLCLIGLGADAPQWVSLSMLLSISQFRLRTVRTRRIFYLRNFH